MLTRSLTLALSKPTLRALVGAVTTLLIVGLTACGDSDSGPTGPTPSPNSGYPKAWEQISFPAEYRLDSRDFVITRSLMATVIVDPDTTRFGSVLVISHDGGSNWEVTRVPDDPYGILALDAFDSDSIILTGSLADNGTNVWVTDDAGATWRTSALPTARFGLAFEVHCFSATGAIVAGDGGAWVTNDAGSTWEPIDVPAPDSEKVITTAFSPGPTGEARATIMVGWGAGSRLDPWSSVGLYEGDLRNNRWTLVREFSPSTDETIFEAVAGGTAYSVRTRVEPLGLGVILTQGLEIETPAIWRTTDGGGSWRRLNHPIGRIALYSGARALRVDGDGSVYWTDNACLSWTPVNEAPEGVTRFRYGGTGAVAFGEDPQGRDLVWQVAIQD